MQPDELKAMRKQAGLSQGDLAAEVGLSQGFIGEMERGEKPIEKRTELAVRYLVEQRLGVRPSSDLVHEEIAGIFDDMIAEEKPDIMTRLALTKSKLQWIDAALPAIGLALLNEALEVSVILERPDDNDQLDQARRRIDLIKAAWELARPARSKLRLS